jgi:hypothetical protein
VVSGALSGDWNNYALPKREEEKVRAIVKADDASYLLMDYVSATLDKSVADVLHSVLLSSSTSVALATIRDMRLRGAICMPIDQSKFDHQPTHEMIASVLDNLIVLASHFVGPGAPDLLMALKAIRSGLTQRSVFHDGGDSWKPVKGILSGWRWTAFLNTLINITEMMMALALTGAVVLVLNALGDDDKVRVGAWHEAYSILGAYQLVGLFANPKKFFISKTRDEYLRQVTTEGRVCGYPARALGSILWRNPINQDRPTKEDRLNEIVSKWLVMMGRVRDMDAPPEWREWMLLDASRATGLSRAEVEQWIHTPATLGGKGLQPWVDVGLEIQSEEVVTKQRPVKYGAQSSIDIRSTELFGETATPTYLQNLGKEAETMYHKKVVRWKDWAPLRGVSWKGGATDIHPHWLESYVTRDDVVSRWLDDDDFDKVLGQLAPASAIVLERLLSHATRRVAALYVKDKLPYSIPSVQYVGDEYVSAMATPVFERHFHSFLFSYGRDHIRSHKDLVRSALAAEAEVHGLITKVVEYEGAPGP